MGSAENRFRILAIAAVLALIVAVPIHAEPDSPQGGDTERSTASERPDEEAPERTVVLYYFHGNRRCKTCRSIEAYAKDAVDSRYAEQVAAGKLQWRVVNMDEPENRHFVETFDLVSSSLILAERRGDEVVRFEVLKDAFVLVRDELRFIQYVQRSLREYLR